MVQQMHPQKPSKLTRVKIGFEYDKTLRDIKQQVKKRTSPDNAQF